MYLSSLTLRGFKSFASATTLAFEPGITCVVGPNGSGKSNVVDALAWVMGEQGAKTLRGGRMEDVIFAGTAGRPPLGRAEVTLTIDNSDGVLPVDQAEVTISRTMFRGGGSEYAVNGRTCRLLDVQELLSDAGIGQEMHVVVGQGQLDSILQATPEERRGFVEEAAGVLKYRKRKEKALRKLAATDANLTRLADVLTEIRRQLKPLGRQADVARRAATVQADVRDARARLLADDLVQAQTALAAEAADQEVLRARRDAVAAALRSARTAQDRLEETVRGQAATLARAQRGWYHLIGLRERLRGTAAVAAERVRHVGEEPAADPRGRDPEVLEAEAVEVDERRGALATELAARAKALQAAVDRRETAETALVEEERRAAEAARMAADRREDLARLAGRVEAARGRVAAGEAEVGRLRAARDQAAARAQRAQRDFTALETRVAGLAAGERGLDVEYEAAHGVLADVEARLAKLVEEERAAERERAALLARREALEVGLDRRDGSGALLDGRVRVPSLLGSLAAMVSVSEGDEAAVSAALGQQVDAVAVGDLDDAVAAVAAMRTGDFGRAALVVAGDADDQGEAGTQPRAPAGSRPALDAVAGPGPLAPLLRRLLGTVVLVDDLAAAARVARENPALTAVTAAGDVVARHHVRGGAATAGGPLEVRAAVEDADERLIEASGHCERLRFDLSRLRQELAEAEARSEVALARLHESDAALAAVAEQLSQLGAVARASRAEADRLSAAVDEAERSRLAAEEHSAACAAELVAATANPPPERASTDSTAREQLVATGEAARRQEVDARLAVRTLEERIRALGERVHRLRQAAEAERATRHLRAAEHARRAAQARVAAQVAVALETVLGRLEGSVAAAARHRDEAEQAGARAERDLLAARAESRELAAELDQLTEAVHHDEVAGAEQRMRVAQLVERSAQEVGLDPAELIAGYGPDQPVPTASGTDAEPGKSAPYDRAEQERRLRAAERALALLGRVNPLALEEFAALEERHAFLARQVDDLHRSRRDLLGIIREVDDRVQQVFAEAFADTAREFHEVFARLFPGGDGRLLLSEPDDLLETGIEVEARPAGKRVKRLSLLSGGERSLVAVAFLVALFKARPSPFYILDEVEAALDETNLARLLRIYEELRVTSQLLVITHQRRTMEVADALYGVSMRDDGVTAMVSQRLREAVSA